jgi:hypothetical protein
MEKQRLVTEFSSISNQFYYYERDARVFFDELQFILNFHKIYVKEQKFINNESIHYGEIINEGTVHDHKLILEVNKDCTVNFSILTLSGNTGEWVEGKTKSNVSILELNKLLPNIITAIS